MGFVNDFEIQLLGATKLNKLLRPYRTPRLIFFTCIQWFKKEFVFLYALICSTLFAICCVVLNLKSKVMHFILN